MAVDEIEENEEWANKSIAKAYHTTERSIGNLRRRFVEKGLDAALGREKREVAPRIKIDGEIEAKIVALTCSNAPDGHSPYIVYHTANGNEQRETQRAAKRQGKTGHDRSRLGRDRLKLGFLTEILFPQNDVRYITIHGNTDMEM